MKTVLSKPLVLPAEKCWRNLVEQGASVEEKEG